MCLTRICVKCYLDYVKRLNIKVEDSLHRKLRIAAAQIGVTIQRFVVAALSKSLRGKP